MSSVLLRIKPWSLYHHLPYVFPPLEPFLVHTTITFGFEVSILLEKGKKPNILKVDIRLLPTAWNRINQTTKWCQFSFRLAEFVMPALLLWPNISALYNFELKLFSVCDFIQKLNEFLNHSSSHISLSKFHHRYISADHCCQHHC